MTKDEAILVLGINSDDSVSDRYEEEIFKLIQVFLKDPVVPALAEGRKKKIIQLKEARNILLKAGNETPETENLHVGKTELNNDLITDFTLEKRWKEMFLQYDRNKAKVRKETVSTYDADNLCFWADQLVRNERMYAGILFEFTGHLSVGTEGKLSESVPVPEILKECENLLNRGVITDELDSFKNITDNLSIFSLSKEIARIRKLNESF